MKTDEAVNTLENFLAKEDLEAPTGENLREHFGIEQVNVFVLFGGSILEGVNTLARAMKEHLAKTYVIVGGAGHTTDTLRDTVREYHPEIETEDRTEAEIFNDCLEAEYGLRADLLEKQSTNCGNNITLLLDLLKDKGIDFESIILCQDVSMQHRMVATLEKYVDSSVRIISLPAYRAHVSLEDGKLVFDEETKHLRGMWETERFLSLLMGEIPRLRDEETGYGPNGAGYIAHVDIPPEVEEAFDVLQSKFPDRVRAANYAFALDCADTVLSDFRKDIKRQKDQTPGSYDNPFVWSFVFSFRSVFPFRDHGRSESPVRDRVPHANAKTDKCRR